MKRLFLYIVACCAAFVTASAQTASEYFNPEVYGVTSLAIAPDARAGSMGDMGVATEADINSQYWNCAKYPWNVARAGVGVSYTPWLRKIVGGINLANIQGFYRIGDYSAISASLRYFGVGDVGVADGNGNMSDDGFTFRPYELAIDVAYSRMLTRTFSMGIALRFILSDMNFAPEATSGKAFAADISMYRQGYFMIGSRECSLAWGLSINNLGSKINMNAGQDNRADFLPTTLRLGLNMTIPFNQFNRLSFGVEAYKLCIPTKPKFKEKGHEEETTEEYEIRLNEDYYSVSSIGGFFKSFGDAPGGFGEEFKEIRWSFGAEYNYNDRFMLRTGYHYESPSKGNRQYFTVGGGFHMSVFTVDAAYCIATNPGNPLDQTMRFTLGFDLDGMKDLFNRKRR
ncbi:MAG: type IX secretion system outer membrane channel protein PorV [Bacteroidaceae bacterium]|nr:type IX secretion system outer membrane channel protein PorV [Bacteroidaceae bacterium]